MKTYGGTDVQSHYFFNCRNYIQVSGQLHAQANQPQCPLERSLGVSQTGCTLQHLPETQTQFIDVCAHSLFSIPTAVQAPLIVRACVRARMYVLCTCVLCTCLCVMYVSITYVYMCVCVYVCMYVLCTCVCIYACVSLCIIVFMHVCIYVCTQEVTYIFIYKRMYVRMFMLFYDSINICMYVSIYV